MYVQHFGLRELPFSIAPDPRYLFMSEQHREALAHLLYGVSTYGGFVLLTGEVGTGKTTVCRCLLEQVPENVNIALILNPKVTAEELLAAICDELQIPYPYGCTSIKMFVDAINSFLLDAHSDGEKTVLLIDEAQNLKPDVLEQIRLLTNLETNQQKLLQIIMIGQPELRDVLAKPDLAQLSQRITARYHMKRLSREDVASYVNHRMFVAGGSAGIFPSSVIGTLHRLSGGIPRLINVICDRALLGAYVEGKYHVDKKLLNRAAAEVMGRNEISYRWKLKWGIAGLFFIICGTAIAAIYYYQNIALFLSHKGGASDIIKVDAASKKAHLSGPSTGKSAVETEMPAYGAFNKSSCIPFFLLKDGSRCDSGISHDLCCGESGEKMESPSITNKYTLFKPLYDYERSFPAYEP